MFTRFKFSEDGISMVELLVVSGILAILISGIVVAVNPLQRIGQSNDAKRKSDLAQLKRALEIYYQDYEQYPPSTVNYAIRGANWGSTWSNYMSRIPREPSSNRRYVYYTPNSGANCANFQCYYIYANLESGGNDRQACFPGTGAACTSAATYGLSSSCGGICNYGVSSANTTP